MVKTQMIKGLIEAGCDDLPGKAAAAFRVLRGARDQRV